MLDDPLVTLGLADAGAHVGQIMDASQPTFFLSYWVKECGRWGSKKPSAASRPIPLSCSASTTEASCAPGAFADVNVIDWDALELPQPRFVFDFPNGAGRYVQHATGYDATIVNGKMFMELGEHTGRTARPDVCAAPDRDRSWVRIARRGGATRTT